MTKLNEMNKQNSKINFDCMQKSATNKHTKLLKLYLVLLSIVAIFLTFFVMICWNNEQKIESTQGALGDFYIFTFTEFGVGVQDVQLSINEVVQTTLSNANGTITLNNINVGDVVSFTKIGYIFSEGSTDYIEEITIDARKFNYTFSAWQVEDENGKFFYLKMFYEEGYVEADESTQYYINGGTGQSLAKMEIETSPREFKIYADIDWAEADNEIEITMSNYYFPKIILEEGIINYTFYGERTYTYSFQMVDILGNPLLDVQAYTQYSSTDERNNEGGSSTQGVLFIQGVRLGTTISFELLGYSFESYSAQQEATAPIKRIGQYAEVNGIKIKFVDYQNKQIPICDETWAPIFTQLVFTRSDEQAVGEMGAEENVNFYLTNAKINDIFKFHLEGYDIDEEVMTRIPSDKTLTVKIRKYLEIKGTIAYPANEAREKVVVLVNGQVATETDDAGQFELTGILQGDEVSFQSKSYVLNSFTASESEVDWTGYLEKKDKDYTTLYIIFGAVFIVILALPIFFARTRKKKRYLTEI